MLTEAEASHWLDETLRREGWPKLTNRVNDYGGWTKGGIVLGTLSRHLSRPATLEELRDLDEPTARLIYEKYYLTPWLWLATSRLTLFCADSAVLFGDDDPTKWLQHATDVVVDGVLGPVTMRAVKAADPDELYTAIWRRRLAKHMVEAFDSRTRDFLRANPTSQLHNLQGWLNRLAEFV